MKERLLSTFRFCFFLAILFGWSADDTLCAGGAPSFQPLKKFWQARLPPLQSKTSLTVRAQITYGDQDEEIVPVEANFYLLDESLVKILKTIHLKPVYLDDKRHRITDADYLEAAVKILTAADDDDEAAVVRILIDDALLKHQSALIRTNEFGRGFARLVKPGRYYLFGIGQIDGQLIVWHQPLAIDAGTKTIEIDQSDAELILATDE